MNISFGWIGGTVWMVLWIGLAIADVGKTPELPGPYPWFLPLLMAAFLIPMFIFGFYAGENSHLSNYPDKGEAQR